MYFYNSLILLNPGGLQIIFKKTDKQTGQIVKNLQLFYVSSMYESVCDCMFFFYEYNIYIFKHFYILIFQI